MPLLAITALLEGRIAQLLQQPELDPLTQSKLSPAELVEITEQNESAAAKNSLDAQLQHWQDGRTIKASDWVAEIFEQVQPTVKQLGYGCFLSPVKKILRNGNTAQQWLTRYQQGVSVPTIMAEAVQEMADQEKDLESKLCQTILVA